METFMDIAWLKIEAAIQALRALLDIALGPLNALGPVAAVSGIALLTVLLTKLLSRTIRTRRHAELKKAFLHWHGLRQEALECDDAEKGRLLARNIDQAELNRAYYDYFFESLMLNLVTKYLPILVFLAYVNETYRPAALEALFGREHLFQLTFSSQPLPVGPVFWFVLSLVAFSICWPLAGKGLRKILDRSSGGRFSRLNETVSQNGS